MSYDEVYCLLPIMYILLVAAFGFPPPHRGGWCGDQEDSDDVVDMLSTSEDSDADTSVNLIGSWSA